jgi:hypothetical protein
VIFNENYANEKWLWFYQGNVKDFKKS